MFLFWWGKFYSRLGKVIRIENRKLFINFGGKKTMRNQNVGKVQQLDRDKLQHLPESACRMQNMLILVHSESTEESVTTASDS